MFSMKEEVSGDLSRSIAKAFGETQGRSVSRVLADNLRISVNAVHFLMALGVVAYLGSRKE